MESCAMHLAGWKRGVGQQRLAPLKWLRLALHAPCPAASSPAPQLQPPSPLSTEHFSISSIQVSEQRLSGTIYLGRHLRTKKCVMQGGGGMLTWAGSLLVFSASSVGGFGPDTGLAASGLGCRLVYSDPLFSSELIPTRACHTSAPRRHALPSASNHIGFLLVRRDRFELTISSPAVCVQKQTALEV